MSLETWLTRQGWEKDMVQRTTVLRGPSNVVIVMHPDMTASEVIQIVSMVEEDEG